MMLAAWAAKTASMDACEKECGKRGTTNPCTQVIRSIDINAASDHDHYGDGGQKRKSNETGR